MQGLDVRSWSRHADRTIQLQLAEFSAYVHWMWPALPDPLTIEWSDKLVLALQAGIPRIYGPADQDPLRAPGGATIVPRWTRKRLKEILMCGVLIHHVGVVHELDPAGPVREKLRGCDLDRRPVANKRHVC